MFRITFPKYRPILGVRPARQRAESSAPATALSTVLVPASLLLSCLTLAFPALAGRPLITDDADVVAPGACQVESWMARTRNEGPSTTALWLNAACSPIDKTEFALGGNRDVTGSDRGTVTTWQIKHVFRRYDDALPGFAIALADQRDRRIHRNAMGETSAIGIASFPLNGDALMAHVNAGITRAWHADTHRYRGRGMWSSALDANVARQTRAAIEAYGVAGERPAWQISIRHDLIPDRLQIDASAGRTFGRGDADQIVTIGLVITTASLLH
ncbi:hypothetical protein RBI22_06980 [Alcaligenaceae bacterium C4P045]|nr:hypothetical protein [Alcaligenaceae bacterium C4P045]